MNQPNHWVATRIRRNTQLIHRSYHALRPIFARIVALIDMDVNAFLELLAQGNDSQTVLVKANVVWVFRVVVPFRQRADEISAAGAGQQQLPARRLTGLEP